ncbi:hypothetical protein IU485_28095 [Nocardia cyriacigeorgica]|uniref:hypothetical protein n=1 Tax=Nocardia cyriacigeorgica TaxID=135487 RepID=UPI0018955763|nr:hypothetical protein [Nocardia cyriacigeorgica]MBF6085235.1 hypothetical protein [Nocardia cyriacigeorgica]
MLPTTLPEIRLYLINHAVRARFPSYDTETNADLKQAYWDNTAIPIDAMLTDPAIVTRLTNQPVVQSLVTMIADTLYRDASGTEIRLTAPITPTAAATATGTFAAVLPGAWLATHSSALLGDVQVVVTAESLTIAGFEPVTE